MSIELTERDYTPLAAFPFQHWDERTGPPYSLLRPLTPDAARRVWQRAVRFSGLSWSDAVAGSSNRFDLLSDQTDWDEPTVRNWLLAQVPIREQRVILCFQPEVAVCVDWGVLCDHWLKLFWTAGCAWPLSERWILLHDGNQFVFGRAQAA